MATHGIEPLNVVQCICRRPRMYTSGGTLAEVLALFAGYELGVLAHGARPEDDSPARSLAWLDEQLGLDGRGFEEPQPADRHEAALRRYESESHVLAALDDFAATLHQR